MVVRTGHYRIFKNAGHKEREMEKYENDTGMPYGFANKYMAEVYVDLLTGDVTDEWGWDEWNYIQ